VEELAAASAGDRRGELPDRQPFPWDFALLGGSVFGAIVGPFTFGIPALAVGAASAIYALRWRDGHKRVAALSAVISLFGVAFGVITSFWLFNVPLWWRSR
jgi:hypothetical protein